MKYLLPLLLFTALFISDVSAECVNGFCNELPPGYQAKRSTFSNTLARADRAYSVEIKENILRQQIRSESRYGSDPFKLGEPENEYDQLFEDMHVDREMNRVRERYGLSD